MDFGKVIRGSEKHKSQTGVFRVPVRIPRLESAGRAQAGIKLSINPIVRGAERFFGERNGCFGSKRKRQLMLFLLRHLFCYCGDLDFTSNFQEIVPVTREGFSTGGKRVSCISKALRFFLSFGK